MRTTPYHYLAGALRVCVDENNSGILKGRVYCPGSAEPIVFSDIGSMLIQIEEFFDLRGFPLPSQRTRSFFRQPPVRAGEQEPAPAVITLPVERGAVATFTLYVRTRQNATWQGKVDWLDGSPETRFQSVIELLRLCDAVLISGKPLARREDIKTDRSGD